MQQIKKRPAVAERFVLWPLGLEADGPSPINSRRYCLRTVKLKISKFYFFREPLHFLQQLPHRGGYVLLFLFCDTIPRFISFCMDFCGMGENLFLCSLGEWTYSYPAAPPMNPALPFIRGHPLPCCRLPFPGRPPQKNTPARPSLSTARPRFPPAVDPARLHMLRTVPLRTVSACRRAASGRYFAKYLFSEP